MVPGEVIQTTVDPYITKISQDALAGLTGAVVVEDAQTGALLALVSSPSFDPNIFTQFTNSHDEKRSTAADKRGFEWSSRYCLIGRLQEPYPPGLDFQTGNCNRRFGIWQHHSRHNRNRWRRAKSRDYGYANWYFSQYGRTEGDISLQRAIARSNDIYFYKAAEFTGPDNLKRSGHGLWVLMKNRHWVAWRSKRVDSRSWLKEQTLHEQWYLGNTYHFGIGQGDVLVTQYRYLS